MGKGETKTLKKKERKKIRALMRICREFLEENQRTDGLLQNDWKPICSELIHRLKTGDEKRFSEFTIEPLECMRIYKEWRNKPGAWQKEENGIEKNEGNLCKDPLGKKSKPIPNANVHLVKSSTSSVKESQKREESKSKGNNSSSYVSASASVSASSSASTSASVSASPSKPQTKNFSHNRFSKEEANTPRKTGEKRKYSSGSVPIKKQKSDSKTNHDSSTGNGDTDTESEQEVAGFQEIESSQASKSEQRQDTTTPAAIKSDSNNPSSHIVLFYDLTEDSDTNEDTKDKSTGRNSMVNNSGTTESMQTTGSHKTAKPQKVENISRTTAHEIAKQQLQSITFPFTCGEIRVMKLGVVGPRYYHNKTCIFPVGYTVERDYPTAGNPLKFEIIERKLINGNIIPLFRVSGNGNVYEALSANDVLNKLKVALKESSPRQGSDGLEMFGITHPYISKLIEGLPGALNCSEYIFNAQRCGTIPETPMRICSDEKTLSDEGFNPVSCDCKSYICMTNCRSHRVGIVHIPSNAQCPNVKKLVVETIQKTDLHENDLQNEFNFAVHHFAAKSFVFSDNRWQIDYDNIEAYPWPTVNPIVDTGVISWDVKSFFTDKLLTLRREAAFDHHQVSPAPFRLREFPKSRLSMVLKKSIDEQKRLAKKNLTKTISNSFSKIENKVPSFFG